MKIYTRTGDRGETGLFGGGRVGKDHVRVEAYGDVDELNSSLGVAIALLDPAAQGALPGRLRGIQADLFTVGAVLATPTPEEGGRASAHLPTLDASRITTLEAWIDEAEAELQPLRNFILPGGAPAAAALHLSRTICRRAERRVVTLSREARVDAEYLIYLNRLSDLLFTWARLANRRAGVADVEWRTGE